MAGRQLRQSEITAKKAQYDFEPSRAPSSWQQIHDRFLCADIARRQDLDAAIAREEDAGDRARRKRLQARTVRLKLRRAGKKYWAPALASPKEGD